MNSQLKMVTYTCYNQELVREPLSLWSELLSIWLRKVDGLRKKLYLRSNQTSLTNSYSQDSTKLLLRLLRRLLKVYQLHQVPLLVKSFSSQNVPNNLRLNKRWMLSFVEKKHHQKISKVWTAQLVFLQAVVVKLHTLLSLLDKWVRHVFVVAQKSSSMKKRVLSHSQMVQLNMN